MIHDAANPEDPGTQLCTPELQPEWPPLPSIHVKAAPLSLSRPEPVLQQQRSKRVRPQSQIRVVSSSFMSGLRLRQDQPISNMKKKKKKRTNSASSSQKQSDAKAIRLFKANIESQFHKNNLASKRQLICAKTDSCLRPIYLFNADSKSRYLKQKDKEDKEGE